LSGELYDRPVRQQYLINVTMFCLNSNWANW